MIWEFGDDLPDVDDIRRHLNATRRARARLSPVYDQGPRCWDCGAPLKPISGTKHRAGCSRLRHPGTNEGRKHIGADKVVDILVARNRYRWNADRYDLGFEETTE